MREDDESGAERREPEPRVIDSAHPAFRLTAHLFRLIQCSRRRRPDAKDLVEAPAGVFPLEMWARAEEAAGSILKLLPSAANETFDVPRVAFCLVGRWMMEGAWLARWIAIDPRARAERLMSDSAKKNAALRRHILELDDGLASAFDSVVKPVAGKPDWQRIAEELGETKSYRREYQLLSHAAHWEFGWMIYAMGDAAPDSTTWTWVQNFAVIPVEFQRLIEACAFLCGIELELPPIRAWYREDGTVEPCT